MGSERPKRRGGVFRRLLNLVLIVYWLCYSAEDTPSAKIETELRVPVSSPGPGSGPARVPVEIPSQTRYLSGRNGR